MNKKTYKQPMTMIVKIQHRHIICASLDGNGMNTKLQSEEVSSAWSRGGNSGWDDEEE